MSDLDNIPEQALAWVNGGKSVAIATVVKTWGSAPRPVGSQLAINENMGMAGSVSGGCVEGAVVDEALIAMRDGKPRVLKFGVSDEDAFSVGLACGGEIHVLVEPIGVGNGIPIAVLEQLTDQRKGRKPVAYLVNTKNWSRDVAEPDYVPLDLFEKFTNNQSGFDADWFINIHNPPLRMIIVGAVHIAQHLVGMARMAGYDPILVDPRGAFASEERFPGEELVLDWPDEALTALKLDAQTAVVTLSHDPKLDDPAIEIALRSQAFYLGCLGSKRTHAKRVARLADAGFNPQQIAKIHAPIGSDIGAKSPAEIAISIMSEITERLRRPETRP